MEMGSTVVVSDIHLGGEHSNHRAFSDFVRWLDGLGTGQGVVVGEEERGLEYPERLILLGDIFELADPVDDDFSYPARHLFESLRDLLNLKCDILLVTGNHDEGLEVLAGELSEGIAVFPRHYPGDVTKPLEIGPRRYVFLHGHQFDRLFRWAGPLAAIPSFMAGMNSMVSRFFPLGGWSVLLLFLLLLAGRLTFLESSGLVQAGLAVTGVFSVPKVFTYLQGSFWARVGRRFADKPKYLDINQVLECGYYDHRKDTIKADVVVYGHTHVPEISPGVVVRRTGKVFVNTGSWVTEEGQEVFDTLAYIDEGGVLLLRWDHEGKTPVLLDSYP